MTLQINMLPGQAAQGGLGIGLLTSTGNPWSVPDEIAYDLVNRGVATAYNWPAGTQSPVSGGISKIPRGSAIRIFDGRAEATHTVVHASGPGETFLSVFELAAAPDWVRPIWINGGAATYDVYGSKAAVLTSGYTDLVSEIAAATWVSTGTVTVPALANSAPGIIKGTVQTGLSNPNRSKTVAVLTMVNTFGADIPLTVMGKGADGANQDFTNWANRSGQRVTFRRQVGNAITTPSTFTSTTNVSYAVCVGVEYGCQGRIYTVMDTGDSTESGQGTYKGAGIVYESVRNYNVLGSGIIGEVANIAVSGSSTGASFNFFSAAFAAGIVPDILVRTNGSINDTGLTMTQSNINIYKQLLSKTAAVCGQYGVFFMPRAMSPTNYTGDSPAGVKNYGPTDLLRQAMNAETMTNYLYDLDYATPVESAARGDGSKIIKAGYTDDGVHANQAGIDATVQYNLSKWPKMAW